MKPIIYISPSMIYSLDGCDGFILSQLENHKLKTDKTYLEKGTDTHFVIENWETEEPVVRDISEKIQINPEIKKMLKSAKERFYFKTRLAHESILLLNGEKIILDVFLFNGHLIITGTIDCIAINHNTKKIYVVDYKTSREQADKDIAQVKAYIYKLYKNWDAFCELVKRTHNYDVSDYDVLGLIDYLNPTIDEVVRVNFNRLEINEFEIKLYKYYTKYTKILEGIKINKTPPRLEYAPGSYCGFCSYIGMCPAYRNQHDLALKFLKENPMTKKAIYSEEGKIEKLISELNKYLKFLQERRTVVKKAKYLRGYEEPIIKKNQQVDFKTLKEIYLDYPKDTEEILRYLKIDITKENTKKLTPRGIELLQETLVTRKYVADGKPKSTRKKVPKR